LKRLCIDYIGAFVVVFITQIKQEMKKIWVLKARGSFS
jgi:hypothetical protein